MSNREMITRMVKGELEDSEGNRHSINESKKALEHLEIAISEKIDEMIGSEKKLKEILCN